MKVRAVAGALCAVAGAIWIAQGTGALGGSTMTGEGLWTGIGAVLVAIGGALGYASWRSRRPRS